MCEIACVGLRPSKKKKKKEVSDGERGAKMTQTERWGGAGCHRTLQSSAQLKKYSKKYAAISSRGCKQPSIRGTRCPKWLNIKTSSARESPGEGKNSAHAQMDPPLTRMRSQSRRLLPKYALCHFDPPMRRSRAWEKGVAGN